MILTHSPVLRWRSPDRRLGCRRRSSWAAVRRASRFSSPSRWNTIWAT
ncbi:hypothetical protein NKH18_40055 [Streptomyces sp. M10(2022)]